MGSVRTSIVEVAWGAAVMRRCVRWLLFGVGFVAGSIALGACRSESSGTAKLTVQPLAAVSVAHLCGPITTSQTLSPAAVTVYVIDCDVPVRPGVTVTLASGVIIKHRAGGFIVSGVLRAPGTATSHAVLTSYVDDSVGGDTNNGPGAPQPNEWRLTVAAGGTLNFDHADVRYGNFNGPTTGAFTFTLTNSTVRSSATNLQRGSVRIQTNAYTASPVALNAQNAPVVSANTFSATPFPLSISSVTNLVSITGNKASGTPVQRVFKVFGSTVANTWTIDPASSAIYQIDLVRINRGATLTVRAGAIVKTGLVDSFDVYGTLRVNGTAAAPVVMSSVRDDTAGGDTNSDGNQSVPGARDFNLVVLQGGSATLDHVKFRYAALNGGAGTSPQMTGNVVITNSVLRDLGAVSLDNPDNGVFRLESSSLTRAPVQVFGGAATVRSNAFFASQLSLYRQAAPIVANDTFKSTANPLTIWSALDLVNVAGNTASGTPVQRVFSVFGSNVLSTWTIDSASSAIYHIDVVSVASGATLTINPGAIVKTGLVESFVVYGTLRVNGTAATPVVMSSVRDDTAGGDTNSDSNHSVPGARDYNLVVLQGASATLDHVNFRYAALNGGAGTSPQTTGNVVVTNSVLRDLGSVSLDNPDNGLFWLESSSLTRAPVQVQGGVAIVRSNSFFGSQLSLYRQAAPIVTTNTFFASANPLTIWSAIDLVNVAGNTALGAPVDRVFSVFGSNVLSAWTIDSASSAIYHIDSVSVAAGATLTINPGAIVKTRLVNSFVVHGTLRVNGTAATPVVMSSVRDDTAGGDTNSDGNQSVPGARDYNLVILPGGSSILDHADFRYAALNGGTGSSQQIAGNIVVTNSVLSDLPVDVTHDENGVFRLELSSLTRAPVTVGGGAVQILSNSLDASPVSVYGQAAPVMRDNSFTGSPSNVAFAADLVGIAGNVWFGTPAERVFSVSYSSVSSTWTVDSSPIYVFNAVDVPDGGTLTASGAIIKSGPTSTLHVGGTLEAGGTTFTSTADDSAGGDSNNDGSTSAPGSWIGIDAELGSTVHIGGGTISYAGIGIDANSGYFFNLLQTDWADVTVSANFVGNSFDIRNGPKDWGLEPGGKAVNADGSILNPGRISMHGHDCVGPVGDPPPIVPIIIWDVEMTGLSDGFCLPGWYEVKGHP